MLLSFDYGILNFIHDNLTCRAGDIFFPIFTKLGSFGLLWIIIAAYLIFIKKDKKYGITVILALLLSLLIGNIILKNVVARPRPFDGLEFINLLIPAPQDFSFPSGHTMSSFAAAFVLYKRSGRSGALALLTAALIGFSRLYLYVHYPSDVICGAVLGILAANIALFVSNKIYPA